MNFLVLSSIIVTNFLSLPSWVHNDLVTTPLGSVEGIIDYFNGIPVRAFLGVPYVKPPVGELRFKKPVPFGHWNSTIRATSQPPGCVQYSTNPFPWYDHYPGLSINCLYLNMWTPISASMQNKKTVLFFVHGGGFRITSNRLDFMNGKALAAMGDVVVVTINYRLGVEGFFYSGTEDAPGNMGLWDIVEALRWVKSNIRYFGGDEHSVTLFGQSAGGIAIGMLTTSPVARGLFNRVIMQSGSPFNMGGEDNSRTTKISEQVVVAVGCASDKDALHQNTRSVVDCLRGKDGLELAVTLANVTANSSRSYYPRYGDDLLPMNPRLAIINGHFRPVDVLIGSNNGDGATLITKSMKDVFGFFGEKDPQINKTFGSFIIRKQFKDFPDPEAVVRQYLGDVEDDNYYKIRFEVFTASGDYSRTCTSNYFAERFAESGVLVYSYFFTRRPSYTPWAPWMLAVHHDETPLVFGYPLRYPQLYAPEDQLLSLRLIQIWSSFAKTGKPNFGDWPTYSREKPIYKVLDVNPVLRNDGPHEQNCDFFRPYFGI